MKKRGKIFNIFGQRLARLRLKHVILGAVLWSLVVAELAILAPAMFLWQRDELQRLEQDTLMLLKANIDITTFPTVADAIKMGERLASFAAVRGGVVMNALGEELGSFGRKPSLTFAQATRGGQLTQLTPDRAFLDVYYPVEKTGLAHPLILRLDASNVNQAVLDRVKERALTVLGVALVAGIVVALVLGIWIVRPVIKLRDAAMAATDDPDRADSFRLRWSRNDELGEAARAFDLLLTAVSIVHQEDLAANQEAIDRSSYAMMTYDPTGKLKLANPAALRLFGMGSLDEFARHPTNYVRMKTVSGTIDVSPAELGAQGDVSQVCAIVTPRGVKRCLLNAVTLRKKSGAVLRHVVVLVDISKQTSYTEHLESEMAQLQAEAQAQRRRLSEMRGLFESCLIIMSNLQSGAGASERALPELKAPVVLTERIVNAWHAEASLNGLVQGRLEHNALPPVKGDPDAVEAVFRQALLAVYTRSRTLKPAIAVDAFPLRNGTARFEVAELPADSDAEQRPDGDSVEAGSAIALLSLSQMVAKLRGQMAAAEHAEVDNALAFVLRVTELPTGEVDPDAEDAAVRLQRASA